MPPPGLVEGGGGVHSLFYVDSNLHMSILAGEKLLVYSAAGGKPLDATMKFPFQAKRWYHLAITHTTGGPLSSSIITLFVDGVLEHSTRLRYPKVTTCPCPYLKYALKSLTLHRVDYLPLYRCSSLQTLIVLRCTHHN